MVSKIFLIFIFCVNLQLIAQNSSLIIGSENLFPFLLNLDGELVNVNAQTQVRVDGLSPGLHKLTLHVFQSNGFSIKVKANISLEPSSEYYYLLKMNNRNEFVLGLQRMVPIPTNNNPPHVVINPNINIHIGGNSSQNQHQNNNPPNPLPGYNGPIGCSYPITDAQFNSMKQTILNTTFESSKLNIAKQIISSNCLLSKDIKEIMDLFTFESSKLEIAKFAYGYTYDLGNYFIVNQAFSFESSIDELDRYIRSKR